MFFLSLIILGFISTSISNIYPVINDDMNILQSFLRISFGLQFFQLGFIYKEFIENKIYNESPSQVIVTQNVSTADELIKLKELQDKGIISKEEFEKQKLKLLQSK